MILIRKQKRLKIKKFLYYFLKKTHQNADGNRISLGSIHILLSFLRFSCLIYITAYKVEVGKNKKI